MSHNLKDVLGPYKGVLHIGASTGQEAEDYHLSGINKMIFIEALPDVFSELVKNIQKFPNVLAVSACVSDMDGQEVKFHVSSNRGESSSFLEPSLHLEIHPSVRFPRIVNLVTSRVDSLGLDLVGIDLLVLDIQGAELMALKGMGELLKNFTGIYTEVNNVPVYKNCVLYPDLKEYLEGFGFEEQFVKWEGKGTWGNAFFTK
jgi:FkbM family methyltransferase